ncbi:MAG: DUF4476 domain-containing protein [Bacteroidia bacterium]
MKHITQNQFRKVKILALFVFIFSVAEAFAASAHYQGSSLRLLLPPTGEHTVVIDNMPFKGIYDRFKIDNLRQGNHRLKIVQLVINRRGQIVNKFVLYNGIIFIPKNAKVWASINNNGRFIIERTYQRNYNRGNNNRDQGYDNGDYDNHYNNNGGENREGNRDDYYDDDWYGYDDQNNDERDNRSNHETKDEQQYSRKSNHRGNETFALTLSAIKKQSFDTERMKIAKNAAVQGNMLSSEVAEITKLFSFESTRLEFAKYAYTYTTDKKNYVIVQDAFQFSSSTSELQDYITQYVGRR